MFTGSGLLRVCKFGGTSLCSADAFKCCAEIIRSDEWRRYIVLSAPGKRYKKDIKITDMLYKAYDDEERRQETLELICERYLSIVDGLGLSFDFKKIFIEQTDKAILEGRDYMASRGEYFSALIMSQYLSYEFVDAAELFCFDENGRLDSEKTDIRSRRRLSKSPRAIIPGFYGSMPDGSIKTFSRGGSDITGSLVARAVGADIYENFTDVDGLMCADPSLVDSPGVIECVSYGELREMSYSGAGVLHEDAIFPVSKVGIPINIKNTFAPDKPGTLIVDKSEKSDGMIGVSGKKGYCLINIRFRGESMRQDIFSGILSVLRNHRIFTEHVVSGVDSMSIVVKEDGLGGKKRDLVADLCLCSDTKWVEIKGGYSIIAAIGKNARRSSFMAELSRSLSDIGIDDAVSLKNDAESIVFFCVESSFYEPAIRAVADIL